MAVGDTRIGALPEDVPLTVERLLEAWARYEDNTARTPDAIHVTHAQWDDFRATAGSGDVLAYIGSDTYFRDARVELVQPGEATGVWCETAGSPPGLPLVAGVISPLRGPVELRQESDAPWRSAVFSFVGNDRYAEFVRDESGNEIVSWQRAEPARQAVAAAVARLASDTAQSARWMLRWIDADAAELLASRRREWREEAHKRTCEACLQYHLRTFGQTPRGGRRMSDPGLTTKCVLCGTKAHTTATPITRAQLEARIAWWQRDRLAECDDEPSKAWFAGNRSLTARLASWMTGPSRPMQWKFTDKYGQFTVARQDGSSAEMTYAEQESEAGFARSARAAVAEIPSGPWEAT